MLRDPDRPEKSWQDIEANLAPNRPFMPLVIVKLSGISTLLKGVKKLSGKPRKCQILQVDITTFVQKRSLKMTEYRLTSAKHHHVLVVVSLNRIHLDGYTSPDSAIAKLIEMGYNPELRYQLNPQRNEFDLYAVIHDLPLSQSRMDAAACKTLWENFNYSVIYTIGTDAAYNPNWLANRDFDDPRRHAQPRKLPTTKLGTAMVGAFKEVQSLPD